MDVRMTLNRLDPRTGDGRAAVSLAVTGSLTLMLSSAGVTGSGPAAADAGADAFVLPQGAIEAPASISLPGEVAPAVPPGTERAITSTATTRGVPARALEAYQRAASILGSADTRCGISWPLVAAIGRVESDHGRFGGSVLDVDGVSRPGIQGLALDGTNGTARIDDTDAGLYDGDKIYDRAVGPMQFIPSTWAVVGVDGDGDERRDPQDIDDAALATAVYLCSGSEDLATDGGANAAIYRYNHSRDYVKLVRSLAAAYAQGDYLTLPTNSYAPVTFGPGYADSVLTRGTRGTTTSIEQPQVAAGKAMQAKLAATPGDNKVPAPQPSAPDDGKPAAKSPVETVKDVVTKGPKAVTEVVDTLAQATAYCQASLSAAEIGALGGLNACVQAYVDGGAAALDNLLGRLGLGDLVGGLLKP